jgi:hypothetical protein
MKAPIRLLLAAAALTLCGHSLAQKDDALLAAAHGRTGRPRSRRWSAWSTSRPAPATPRAWPPWPTLLEDELKALAPRSRATRRMGNVVGDNIVGRIKGKGGKKLLLMAHMDTVYVKGTLAKAAFRIDGNRAFGPGIADDKGGVAVILHTLKLLKARGFDGFGSDHGDVQHRRGDGLLRLARADPEAGRASPTSRAVVRAHGNAIREMMTLGHRRHRVLPGQHQGAGLACRRQRPSWA